MHSTRHYPITTGTLAAATERYCFPVDNAAATNNYTWAAAYNSLTFTCTNTGGANAITASLIEGCNSDPDTDEEWVAIASNTLTPAVDATESDNVTFTAEGMWHYIRVTLTSTSGTTYKISVKASIL